MTAGRTSVFPATNNPSFRYRKVHSHWNPSTLIWTWGVSRRSMFMSVASPNGKRTAMITAGMAKKTTRDLLPPTVCGAGSSSRLRYRTMHQISTASTPRKTGAARIMMMTKSRWTSWPWGEIPSLAQPVRSRRADAAANRAIRVRVTGSGLDPIVAFR